MEGTNATVGITDYAQKALGDVVFVDLPAVGKKVTAGGTLRAFVHVACTSRLTRTQAPSALSSP